MLQNRRPPSTSHSPPPSLFLIPSFSHSSIPQSHCLNLVADTQGRLSTETIAFRLYPFVDTNPTPCIPHSAREVNKWARTTVQMLHQKNPKNLCLCFNPNMPVRRMIKAKMQVVLKKSRYFWNRFLSCLHVIWEFYSKKTKTDTIDWCRKKSVSQHQTLHSPRTAKFTWIPCWFKTKLRRAMLFLPFTNKAIQSGTCLMALKLPAYQVYVPFCGLISSILTTDDQFALDLC